jgi:peptidyl-prolyl cis-trans isomerase B (cyclophilin B)
MINVIMKTSEGEVEIELNDEKAPLTVANFLKYVDDGFYDGTIFHRVINNFMIQGGGFLPGMKEKETNDSVKNEADNGLKNLKGTIAMARTQIPDSASSQFFINVKDNDFLNHTAKTMQGWGYAVFGKVVNGMDVVDKIKVVETGSHGYFEDVPKKNVEIISVKRK